MYTIFKKYRDDNKIKTLNALIYSQHCHGCGEKFTEENYGNEYCDISCRTYIKQKKRCSFANSKNGCEICLNNQC